MQVALIGELPYKANQLPDLVVAQSLFVNRHRGSPRPVFDDPKQLAVRYCIHQFRAGKVSWRGSQSLRQSSIAVSPQTMTKPAGGGLGFFVIKQLSFLNIFGRIRQGIFFLQIPCRSAPGFSILRTNSGSNADNFPDWVR